MKRDPSTAAKAFVAESFADCPCVPKVGSDYRRPPPEWEARSGLFGFEFRTLDKVPVANLADVLRILWYAFDASVALPASDRALASPQYNAVKSEAFVGFLVACAKAGSAAALTRPYADALNRVLKIPKDRALTGKETAHAALQAVSDHLFERFGGGKGEYSRYVDVADSGALYEAAPRVPDLNKDAAAYHAEMNKKQTRKSKPKKRPARSSNSANSV